ncbi:hypothetical protein RP20_CCG013372 [Aedes albopictus]|nr:hypothetical protein RP20_CCG013372 [Aedes albopictus]
MIGRPLLAVPEPSYHDTPSNRLSRWQYVQQLREHFWRRWSKEYLSELQVRGKWTQKRVNVRPGLIVLLKEDNIPPQNWKLGRVVTVYPGADGLVRVADIKTQSGTYQRSIHKLAPLPILDNLASSEPNPAPIALSGGRMFSPQSELKYGNAPATSSCAHQIPPPIDQQQSAVSRRILRASAQSEHSKTTRTEQLLSDTTRTPVQRVYTSDRDDDEKRVTSEARTHER